jgi:RHS repeat-associated protein
MASAVSITRGGQPVEGAATRLTPQLLKWAPSDPATYPVGGTYTFSGTHLTDLAGNAAAASTTFTHLSTTAQTLLLAYAAPTDTQPEAASAYGLTTLFQGRTWHGDLGIYFYRARWYLPEAGVFGERDLLSYRYSANLTQFLGYSVPNIIDPTGRGAQVPPKDEPPVLFPFKKEEPETPDVPLDPGLARSIQAAGSELQMGPLERFAEVASPTQVEIARELLTGIERTIGVDYSDQLAVNFILNQAEKHHGSSGVSIEGMGVHYIAGAHVGANIQVFYNRDWYSAGLYFFETLTTVAKTIFKGGPEYENPIQGLSGPFGVIGENIGVSISVNAALASTTKNNVPAKWTKYFDTVSLTVPVPLPPAGEPVFLSIAGFRSDVFIGAEIGPSSPGLGIAYTRPYFHAVNSWEHLDKESVRAIYRIALRLARYIP